MFFNCIDSNVEKRYFPFKMHNFTLTIIHSIISTHNIELIIYHEAINRPIVATIDNIIVRTNGVGNESKRVCRL